MDENKKTLLVAAPRKPGMVVIPGTIDIIANCGHQVALSPHGVKMLATNPEAKIECMDCIDPQKVFGGQVGEVPGAIAAASKFVGVPENTFRDVLKSLAETYGGTIEQLKKDMEGK